MSPFRKKTDICDFFSEPESRRPYILGNATTSVFSWNMLQFGAEVWEKRISSLNQIQLAILERPKITSFKHFIMIENEEDGYNVDQCDQGLAMSFQTGSTTEKDILDLLKFAYILMVQYFLGLKNRSNIFDLKNEIENFGKKTNRTRTFSLKCGRIWQYWTLKMGVQTIVGKKVISKRVTSKKVPRKKKSQ